MNFTTYELKLIYRAVMMLFYATGMPECLRIAEVIKKQIDEINMEGE